MGNYQWYQKHQTSNNQNRYKIKSESPCFFAHDFFSYATFDVQVSNPLLRWLPGCQLGCSCSTYAFLSLLPLGCRGEDLGLAGLSQCVYKYIIYSGIFIRITTIFTCVHMFFFGSFQHIYDWNDYLWNRWALVIQEIKHCMFASTWVYG